MPEHSRVTRHRPDDSALPITGTSVFRVEVRRAARIAFAERPVFGCQFTLSSTWPVNTEFLLRPDQTLGWVDHNRLDHLRVKPHYPHDENLPTAISAYFSADDGCLRSLIPLTVYLLGKDVDTLRKNGVLLFSHPL